MANINNGHIYRQIMANRHNGDFIETLFDAITVTGEGKRVAAALNSASRRHADNANIVAYTRQYPFEEGKTIGEIVLFSNGGAWTGRRYELHISVCIDKATGRVSASESYYDRTATLYTSNSQGEGIFKYEVPIVLAWNTLMWALCQRGRLTASLDEEVESHEVGGYIEPLRGEASQGFYIERAWAELDPIIKEAFSQPETEGRHLVLDWELDPAKHHKIARSTQPWGDRDDEEPCDLKGIIHLPDNEAQWKFIKSEKKEEVSRVEKNRSYPTYMAISYIFRNDIVQHVLQDDTNVYTLIEFAHNSYEGTEITESILRSAEKALAVIDKQTALADTESYRLSYYATRMALRAIQLGEEIPKTVDIGNDVLDVWETELLYPLGL